MDSDYLKALKATAETSLATAMALLKIAEQLQHEADENKYISLESAAAALGGISAGMLKDRCDDGRFKLWGSLYQFQRRQEGQLFCEGFSRSEIL